MRLTLRKAVAADILSQIRLEKTKNEVETEQEQSKKNEVIPVIKAPFKVIVIVRRRRFFSFLKQQCYDNVNGCHKKSAFNASRYLSPRSQNVRFSFKSGLWGEFF